LNASRRRRGGDHGTAYMQEQQHSDTCRCFVERLHDTHPIWCVLWSGIPFNRQRAPPLPAPRLRPSTARHVTRRCALLLTGSNARVWSVVLAGVAVRRN
jgi:hypothetical protein